MFMKSTIKALGWAAFALLLLAAPFIYAAGPAYDNYEQEHLNSAAEYVMPLTSFNEKVACSGEVCVSYTKIFLGDSNYILFKKRSKMGRFRFVLGMLAMEGDFIYTKTVYFAAGGIINEET